MNHRSKFISEANMKETNTNYTSAAELKQHFITTERPYQEGAVEVFEQNIPLLPVKKAVLTSTALGVYEAELNGEKVGDQMFAPGYTYYYHDLFYQSHDVTEYLQGHIGSGADGSGADGSESPCSGSDIHNTLRVYLGQGWYCGRFTCDNKTQIYGERPAVSWVLELELEDGSRRIFCSDDDSVHAVPGPYGYAGFYDGEIYYAEGTPRSGSGDGQSKSSAPETPETPEVPEVFPPVPYEGPLPDRFSPTMIKVKLQEEMPVQSVSVHDDVTILDFGQNFAGIIEIDPTKMKGSSVRIRHGEILNPDGSLYTANLRKAKAELIYHRGTDTRKYRPRFTYMGFRYAEISGTEYVPGLVTAYALCSDMERTGAFTCGNPLADRLFQNQLWGQRSNYVEVPTDCPQRDERMGYPGDGQVFALTGAYNYDTETFWAKYLRDMSSSQQDNSEGYVGPTIPADGPAGVGFINMLGWGNAITIIPEMLYRQFGTDRYLKEYYENMKSHVECEIRHMGGPQGVENLWLAPNLGDWLCPGKDIAFMAMHNGPVSNAFIVNDLRILSWAAERFGKTEDALRYRDQLEKTRSAYIQTFINEDGSMRDDYQGAYIMALKHVLPQGELWDKLFAKLVEKIHQEGMQTGFFSTEHLLPLLADHGETSFAFDLLLQEDCPGWMYQVLRGATTTWERWDAILPDGSVNEADQNGDNMVSFNHYAFGSVGEFYYTHILGIQPLEPGYEKVLIRPFFDERLSKVSGSYLSRHGRIAVEWEVKDGHAALKVETPTAAKLVLPDGSEKELEKGEYEFKVEV